MPITTLKFETVEKQNEFLEWLSEKERQYNIPTIVLEFETEDQKDRFFGWFLDGGGEDNFYSTEVELRNALKPFITKFDKDTIKFFVCDEE